MFGVWGIFNPCTDNQFPSLLLSPVSPLPQRHSSNEVSSWVHFMSIWEGDLLDLKTQPQILIQVDFEKNQPFVHNDLFHKASPFLFCPLPGLKILHWPLAVLWSPGPTVVPSPAASSPGFFSSQLTFLSTKPLHEGIHSGCGSIHRTWVRSSWPKPHFPSAPGSRYFTKAVFLDFLVRTWVGLTVYWIPSFRQVPRTYEWCIFMNFH